MKTYELFMRTRHGDKPVKEFTAEDDQKAFDKAQDVYDALPSVPYLVREKGSDKVIVPE